MMKRAATISGIRYFMPSGDSSLTRSSTSSSSRNHNQALRFFTKFSAFATFFLIYAGGMVTSTGSGLSVPDWPLSYGMFFPPMVGGVFYEHGHRMIASVVGFLTLIQAIWIWRAEKRLWVKVLGWVALAAVIAQGILGGITVLFFLPTPISVAHAVLAQTFFILMILIAYTQSVERFRRETGDLQISFPSQLKVTLVCIVSIYLQLILGAIMRHTQAGLAIPDFPKMGGEWLPAFDTTMLSTINVWRFEHNLEYVNMGQVVIHFLHRLGAVIVFVLFSILFFRSFKSLHPFDTIKVTSRRIYGLIIIQILLGILTVLSEKSAMITSLHVVNGAAILGLSIILLLRLAPLQFHEFKKQIFP
jgi:cytochrome c oxidase assembly protein subunit 15